MFEFVFTVIAVVKKIKILDMIPIIMVMVVLKYLLRKNEITEDTIIYVEYRKTYSDTTVFILHFSNINLSDIISIMIKKKEIGVEKILLTNNKTQKNKRINIFNIKLVLKCLLFK